MIDNEFMYKFAKRLALDARELSGRSHVGMVLRCYLPANVSYWPGHVVVRDGDNFVDSYIVHPPLIGQGEFVLRSKSRDVLISQDTLGYSFLVTRVMLLQPSNHFSREHTMSLKQPSRK